MHPALTGHTASPLLAVRVLIVALLAAISLGVSGCSDSQTSTLRIAVNPWPGYGYFAIAEEKGLFAEAGALDVEIIETASLGDSVRAFERGQVDLIGGTLAELSDINHHGRRPARAILVLDRSLGGDMIVSGPSINRLEALEGKRLALEPGSANVLVLAAAANRSALDLDRVTLVPMPQTEMPTALKKGRVDAAISYPPTAQDLLALPGTHRLFDTGDAPNAVVDVLIAADEAIDRKAKPIAALVDAHERALAWSRAHPEAAAHILARHTHLSVDEISSLKDSIEMLSVAEQQPMWATDGPLIPALIGATSILSRLHDHRAPAMDKAQEMLDDRFVEEALAR